MTREEKNQIVEELVSVISSTGSFYIIDIGTLNSEKTSKLRRLCYNRQVQLKVAKNSLIKKALERIEGDYSEMIPAMKGSSAVMIAEIPNVPAKLIKEFRKESDRPVLKAASIDGGIYVGER